MNPTTEKLSFRASIGLLGLLCARSLFAADAAPLLFVQIAPCRVVDTRIVNGDFGAPDLLAGTRDFSILSGDCGIPDSAVAYSINVTVAPPGHLSYLSLYPTGEDQPQTPTLDAENGRVFANAVKVAAGTNGSIRVYTTDETDLILEVHGYYLPAPAADSRAAVAIGTTTAASAPALPTLLGAWSNSKTYALSDVVDYNDSSYISLVADNTSNEPGISTSQWGLLEKGATGSTIGTAQLTFEFSRNNPAANQWSLPLEQEPVITATAPQDEAAHP